MTLQQWLFSIKGRIGRRDFWIWIAIWLVTMSALFTPGRQQSAQPADGGVYYRLPAVADGGGGGQAAARSRQIRAVGAADGSGVDAAGGELGDVAAGLAVGRRALCADADYRHDVDRPGAFVGTRGENKFGKETQTCAGKRTPDYQ